MLEGGAVHFVYLATNQRGVAQVDNEGFAWIAGLQGAFPDASPPIEPPSAKIFLLHLIDVRGRVAEPASPTPENDSGRFTARFHLSESWSVTVLDSASKLPIGGLIVIEETHTSWGLATPLLPPTNVHPVQSEAVGVVELVPTGPRSRFWIGAAGYSWLPYQWQRRYHMGRVVELESAATLEVVCPSNPEMPLEVEILGSHRDVLASWWGPRALPDLPPLPPGTYTLRLRSHLESPSIWWSVSTTLEGGAHHRIEHPCGGRSFDLLADVTRADDPGAFRAHLLDPLGASGGSTDPARPDSVASGEVGWLLRWERLPPGLYVVETPEGMLHPADLRQGDARIQIDPDRVRLRFVHFVDPSTGAPEELTWIRWSALDGTLREFPLLFLPQSGFAQGVGGSLPVEAPPGELRMIVQDSHGARGVYLDVDERLDYVLELERPFELVVRAPLMPFSLGLLTDIAFLRDSKPVLPSEIAIRTDGAGRSLAAEASLVLGRGRPHEIFVPASKFDPTQGGEWIGVPEGSARAILTLGRGLEFE